MYCIITVFQHIHIYNIKNINNNMNLRGKTKIAQRRNSFTSTIPIAIVQMMGWDKGDTILWELKIEDNKPVLTVKTNEE